MGEFASLDTTTERLSYNDDKRLMVLKNTVDKSLSIDVAVKHNNTAPWKLLDEG